MFQIDALSINQDTTIEIPNESSINKQLSTQFQLEGGGSNSNINQNDKPENNPDQNDQQQQQLNLSYNQGTQYQIYSTKNQPLQEHKAKKPNVGFIGQNNYNMFPNQSYASKGQTNSRQPSSSSNLYSNKEGGKSNRDAALPEILSQNQLQNIQSQQNMSTTNLNNAYTDRKASEKTTGNSGAAKSCANQPASIKSSSTQKRYYLYCIDTRQIISMIDYCIEMIKVPCKEINQQIYALEKQQKHKFTDINVRKFPIEVTNNNGNRSKSSNEVQTKKGQNILNNPANYYMKNSSLLEEEKQNITLNSERRKEIFCSGNKDTMGLVLYFNYKLKNTIENSKFSQKQQLFKVKGFEAGQNEEQNKGDQIGQIDFCKVFSIDQKTQNSITRFVNHSSQTILLGPTINFENNLVMNPQFMKFTYLVENEKILTKKMFYVDVQRDSFKKTLKELKEQLSNFISRKYKKCITKIGFSSQQELFNIFNKMFNSKKGFFNNIYVRKVLGCFWQSIREIFFQIRLKQFDENQNSSSFKIISKLNNIEELMLKNNFYMRLELLARGRQIYEPYIIDYHMQSLHAFIAPNSIHSSNLYEKQSSGSLTTFDFSYQKLYPLHQAIFESNLRQLSKYLKQEVEGIFYINKNTLDPCGNTPLMLAVKLGNLDAVKILSDQYTCPKLRSLPDLMNAKEVAIAMKHQPILKILISSNSKNKMQFFEDNKNAIFKVMEGIPDFKVDLNFTCDSNLFPVFSSVAPSDTYKIYKQGSNLRLDMTLLGLQGFNLLKGNITVLYKGRNSGDQAGELLIIDNKINTVNNVFNRNQENKINNEIQNILTGKKILKKYLTQSSILNLESDRQNRPIFKNINDYECQKYTMKSKYTMTKYQMNLNQIDQIKGLKNFQEYVELLEIDYLQLMEAQLSSLQQQNEIKKHTSQEHSNSTGNFFTNRFKAASSREDKYEQNNGGGSVLNTSRINLGGTSKLSKHGGLSSRDGSNNIRNLAGEQYQQMHTQEDNNRSSERFGGIFGHRGSSQTLNNMLANNKQIIVKKTSQKQIQANLWLSKTYPFDIEQFLPLFHVLSFCSKQIRQFNKFLLKYPLPKSCFPVEARIPLMMTMEAVFSFKNLQLGFNDPSVFELDKVVSEKQKQNMAQFVQQQMQYLNYQSSLDTQEDKQARALREIYKLCKTDENECGDNLNNYYELYKIYQANEKPAKRNSSGNESDSSDNIKDRFDKMKDEAYDINKDLVLIEENEDQNNEVSQISSKLNNKSIKKAKIIQMNQEEEKVESEAQSRNFATKSSFNDVKKSIPHGDFLKMRKSNAANGRQPSMQFSLQSDITESIEVSERSFNDKLAKLQIHSFQNVKFMSQLKKNREFKENPHEKNLEKMLNDQFLVNHMPPNKLQLLNNNQQYSKNQQFYQQVAESNQDLSQIQLSHISNGSINMENIYDSKLNEQRPKINKSLGKHQIKNNLHMYAKNMKSQAIEVKNGKPPIVVNQSKNIKPKNVTTNLQFGFSQSIIPGDQQKQFNNDFLGSIAKPSLKQNTFINQPNSNIGNSIVSLGISHLNESSMQIQSVSSMSFVNIESRNTAAQQPSSTNASSKAHLSFGSQPSQNFINPKQSKILDSVKYKMSIRNQNGNQNYLNTIESEGNLPTQHFGKDNKNTKDCNNLSQRSIHSLEEVEDEEDQEKIIKCEDMGSEDNYGNQFSRKRSQDGISLELSQNHSSQVFSYEKQKLNQVNFRQSDSGSLLQSKSNYIINSANSNKQMPPQNKLNFFQKVTNFISENITDRKHHSNSNINDKLSQGQQNVNSNTTSKSHMAQLIEDRRLQNHDFATKHILQRDQSGYKIENRDMVLTHKKIKRAVVTPKNNEFVSPLRNFNGPSTTGRDEYKKQKAQINEYQLKDNRSQQELANNIKNLQSQQQFTTQSKNAIHLQQMINIQLKNRQGNNKGGPNITVTKPLEPHRNTTQTEGSLNRVEGQVLQKDAQSAFFIDDQSPQREGQIKDFNRLRN